TGVLPKQIRIPFGAHSYTAELFELGPVSPHVTGIIVFAQHGFFIGPPSHEQWHQNDIFKEIVARNPHDQTLWYYGADEGWFTTWVLHYYSKRYHVVRVAAPQDAQFLLARGDLPDGVTDTFAEVKEYPLPYG